MISYLHIITIFLIRPKQTVLLQQYCAAKYSLFFVTQSMNRISSNELK